ncbi:MAG TPA: bifunctional UDP-N-acetylglucosamine diphosphorylase/glucosamine-1-phosphate N-acetyltransferase GlmU [Terriglobales bacterium]|nr:bifunctional UDP-N-acetylglucosamine diphosphorylase/glucosamine-1-phosphate N-acetyltransferase GlmU [Terriglobales bacterium]
MSSQANRPGRTAIAIMAAGKGTRLKSKHPKVLHEVGGKPLLAHVIAAARQVVAPEDVYVIVGHEAERVRSASASTGVKFVVQEPQRGTGHALMCAAPQLAEYEQVVVLSGDAPLITAATIANLRDYHQQKKAAMTILSAELENPTGYGRLIHDPKRREEIKEVVEEKSATPKQKKLREINSGFYVFSTKPLFEYIKRLTTDNPHGEYYLTDMAAALRKAKQRVVAIKTENPSEILGSNTRADLVDLDRKLRMQKCLKLMSEGVTIFYPETCVIDWDVVVGADTTIEPFVQLLGNTRVGSDCRVRSHSIIQNSHIGDDVLVRPGCVLDEAVIANGASLGPYSHLRPGSEIGEGAHVGNFVETKKIRLGKKSKANHLTYLGDAEIGDGVNIGAGTITCNYDGVHKHKTVIEDGVFVGSDSTLVAPVKLGKGSYVGAASCITDDVPQDSLAIGRSRQITKAGWAKVKSTMK